MVRLWEKITAPDAFQFIRFIALFYQVADVSSLGVNITGHVDLRVSQHQKVTLWMPRINLECSQCERVQKPAIVSEKARHTPFEADQ